VASAVGGPLEILDHGRTGLLVPPGDVDALAGAVLQLAIDPALRQRIGAGAATTVRSEWLWPHLVAKMRSVYEEAMRVKNRAVRSIHLHPRYEHVLRHGERLALGAHKNVGGIAPGRV
jgi:phosphatidylinositol alpha 1,6-mannosyltransferase